MSLTIIGLRPKTEHGRDFDTGYSEWAALCTLVMACCDDILTREEIKDGFGATGYAVSADKAKRIADRLTEVMALRGSLRRELPALLTHLQVTGKQKELKTKLVTLALEAMIAPPDAALTTIDWREVLAFVEFLRASGGFTTT